MKLKPRIFEAQRVSARHNAGQALIELSLISLLLITLLFGLIDFSRAILTRQVITNLSREGANLASRGTSLTSTLDALVLSANPLTIAGSSGKGYIILTSVGWDTNGKLVITAQEKMGAKPSSSKIGNAIGDTPILPNPNIPDPSQKTLVIAEVFYEYSPVTPVGTMLGSALPSKLYDVSYF